MPERLFFELKKEKSEKIIEAAIYEFAMFGFNESSTNRIVKDAKIGKGSLFKYFSNKEDLYFYILDTIVLQMIDDLKDELATLPNDLIEKLLQYSVIEMKWYKSNFMKYQLLKKAFLNNDSEIYKKTLEKFQATGDAFYDYILKDVETAPLNFNREKTLKVLKFFLKSFNDEFLIEHKEVKDINEFSHKYVTELKAYLLILKQGLYK